MNMILKVSFVIFTMFFLLSKADAQNGSEPRTLFGENGKINIGSIGFFVAPGYAFSQMDGAPASTFYIRGGVTMNDRFSLGGYFNTSLNEIFPESEIAPNVYMDYWSIGGFIEYTFLAERILHLTFPVSFGIGEVEMDGEQGNIDLGEANFFQIEPAALLQINLHQNIRLFAGIGYRFVNQMTYRNFDQTAISGLTYNAGIKIGLFR